MKFLKITMQRSMIKYALCVIVFIIRSFTSAGLAQSLSGLPYDVLLGRQTDQSIALSVLAYSTTDVIVDLSLIHI